VGSRISVCLFGQEAQATCQQGEGFMMDRNSLTAILGTSVSFGLSEVHLFFASLSAILTCVFVIMQMRKLKKKDKE